MKNVVLSTKTMRLFLSTLLAVLFPLAAVTALAAGMPAFEHLDPLASKLSKPTVVALDNGGRIYVAETGNNLVRIYSQKGDYLHTIMNLAKPISLAVDADGNIYIGNKDRGNVEVYDSSFRHLFNLGEGTDGQGTGEFGQPNDIDIGSSGQVYVVDKTSSVIKIYEPRDGSYRSSLGEPGNGDGQFHHPVSLVFDTMTDELVVLDLQESFDRYTGKMIDGARIQFLGMDGTFKRGYTKFGYNRDNGELVTPMHVAVDAQSRVYVSDSRLQKVMVYDNEDCEFRGMMDDPDHPLRTPLGLAFGKANKLYVASLAAGQVEVYGIDSYIGMEVNPPSLSFEELQGEPSGTLKTIVINNTGNSTFSWTASSPDQWLSLPATQGSVPASNIAPVNVGVDITGLAPGLYQGSVRITAGMAVTETVTVTLTVLPSSILSVFPDALHFESTVGTTPAALTLSIKNAGGSTLAWNANVDRSWLTLNATSGIAPSSLKVYADTTSLAAGSYSGTVTITKQGDNPEMRIIPVSLTLSEPAESPIIPPPVPTPGGQGKQVKWKSIRILEDTRLNGIWGESAAGIYAVGSHGTILLHDGKNWFKMDSGIEEDIYGIWGASAVDVYAVGANGIILHFDGSDWVSLPAVVQETLRDTWGSSPDDVYAVSRNGSIIESLAASTKTGVALRGIWGSSAANVFTVGENGAILHFDGGSWSAMDSDTTQWLNAIWGSSGSDIFAVGENGAIVHFDGTSWRQMNSRTNMTLQSVWGRSGSEVFAVGANGLVL